MKMSFVLILFVLGCVSCATSGDKEAESAFSNGLGLIPAPAQVLTNPASAEGSHFLLSRYTRVEVESDDPQDQQTATLLAAWMRDVTGYALQAGSPDTEDVTNLISLVRTTDLSLGDEGYRLTISKQQVVIEAQKAAGLFYGAQSLRQLWTSKNPRSSFQQAVIPCLVIEDEPRFSWRGMLLDCGRHFMDKDFVKRYIDLLAFHKMNRLHWHLTEDQGWRIEIKKYPRLTEVGAWRTYDDKSTYGGFYTQEDVKEIVAYAKARFITVVPEIEMPGHSVAALAAYPELSCSGGPFEVETQWGVHKDVYCAGNERTFNFLEDVLLEVMDLFDSPFIHIGGDECPKDRWHECEKCQARIKNENLKDEHELQSWFIRRIEKFLARHDRRLIGWDEILEGGLAPAATVQSWRGMKGAIAAATTGHDAIVSPTSHAYFDYDIDTTDLRQVYGFEPIPPELTTEQAKHILGGECNMWTERAPQETIDSKVFPRILAMAEVLWSPQVAPAEKQERYETSFYPRVRHHYTRLDQLGVQYGPESRPATILCRLDEKTKTLRVTMETGEADLDLHYTTDGSTPSPKSARYEAPLSIDQTATLKAQAWRDGRPYGELVTRQFKLHQATGRKPQLTRAFSHQYSASGGLAITDGLRGTNEFRDGNWQGYEAVDFETVIDLGTPQTLNRLSAGFLQNVSVWIFLPKSVEFAISTDGQKFRTVGTFMHTTTNRAGKIYPKEFESILEQTTARYVRVRAEGVKTCPEWHAGAGGRCWIFIDEVVVE
ncbi:MAG: hexosaminidase [Planctomycetota bacterium]|jgi:hexosaminidase